MFFVRLTFENSCTMVGEMPQIQDLLHGSELSRRRAQAPLNGGFLWKLAGKLILHVPDYFPFRCGLNNCLVSCSYPSVWNVYEMCGAVAVILTP